MKSRTLTILVTLTVSTTVTTPPNLALIHAAKSGNALGVTRLLRSGASPDTTDAQNKTALAYVTERYGSQGPNSPHADAFILNDLLKVQSNVCQEIIEKSLHTGNAALIKAVITAFHKKSGTLFHKEEYIQRTAHSKNLKLLKVGIETGILKPDDITTKTIKQFLIHSDTVSPRTIKRIKTRIKQTPLVLQREFAALQDNPDTTTGTSCPICTDPLNNTESQELECTHTFHEQCLAEWFLISATCPSCRRPTPVHSTDSASGSSQ